MNEKNNTKKVWQCSHCKIYFYPESPNFNCPVCKSHATFPSKDFDDSKQEMLYRSSGEPVEINCPKCGAVMRRGFMVERNTPLQVATIGEGIYWSPDEKGWIMKRLAVKAYACPECGYIEHYIRRLDVDRFTILKAPTK